MSFTKCKTLSIYYHAQFHKDFNINNHTLKIVITTLAYHMNVIFKSSLFYGVPIDSENFCEIVHDDSHTVFYT